MRYGDTFSYEIHAEEGTENIRIPPILIQTFIENAIKHSNTFDDPIIIRTDIAWMTAGGNSHENIQIQVMDTGCGFSGRHPAIPKFCYSSGTSKWSPYWNYQCHPTSESAVRSGEKRSLLSQTSRLGGACVTILLPASLIQFSA